MRETAWHADRVQHLTPISKANREMLAKAPAPTALGRHFEKGGFNSRPGRFISKQERREIIRATEVQNSRRKRTS